MVTAAPYGFFHGLFSALILGPSLPDIPGWDTPIDPQHDIFGRHFMNYLNKDVACAFHFTFSQSFGGMMLVSVVNLRLAIAFGMANLAAMGAILLATITWGLIWASLSALETLTGTPHIGDFFFGEGESYQRDIYAGYQYAYKFAVYGGLFGQWTGFRSSHPLIYNTDLASEWTI